MKIARSIGFVALALSCNACGTQQPADAQTPEAPAADEEAAIFTAAGFTKVGEQWQACEATDSASYSPGEITLREDLNGDGRTDAVVVESSAMCFGMAGQSFAIVSQQADGSWKLIGGGIGIPTFLEESGTDGWPDIEVGGPGFCFPVWRYNGTEYDNLRNQYEGKPCQPPL